MVPLNPKITNAGLALFPNPTAPGFQVTLTHIAIGTAKYSPTGAESALAAEVARFPIIAGGIATVVPNQVQIGANITDTDPDGRSANDQWIGEIGFYAGPTLFAIWSRADKALFYKTSDFDIPVAYRLDVSRLPANSVTVTVDMAAASMASIIFQHENRTNPHPQYTRKDKNLSDVTDVPQSRANLGLKSAAVKDVYQVSGAVGSVHFFPATAAPLGYLKLNGALLSRAAYADLWEFAQASGNMAVSDALWMPGQFSPGDDATTFRIPDVRASHIRALDDGKGVDSGRAIGTLQDSAVMAHSHTAGSSSAGSHSHGASSSTVADHSHTGTTSTTAAHSHGGSTSQVADHSHGGSTSVDGSHSHSASVNARDGSTAAFGDGGSSRTYTATTASAGDHSHSISTTGAGGHGHSISTDSAGMHGHSFTSDSAGGHSHSISTDSAGSHSHSISVNSTGIVENRVRNIALLACIKY